MAPIWSEGSGEMAHPPPSGGTSPRFSAMVIPAESRTEKVGPDEPSDEHPAVTNAPRARQRAEKGRA
jgi:hypothetical protein